ncbi:thiamine pyrophosphate-binding protein [Acidovorax sp. NCPPB 3859]|nr:MULTISPECIES: thiamine pyrophosphate-binding protein [unclassified Acidovorax]MDA8449317.1 thiamine pyrophosphate-binding protein [Acidovorax sp. GBBC 3297]MDA8458594.1 thiamine pyrophosphate-binding protein [Acidovorax sp. GBBC 3333]MDA8463632.1 thiamine pyrophosphate-binding protein [Acidovorax sp. GBBC 3332]MDA8468497.1 thiamine pyrophosphate-binding protein [Acidovorax sp. GBBC 3299]WCM76858.1 thiamine pyrophosphate-binding protein [Acidovorax sp. GBBC 712]
MTSTSLPTSPSAPAAATLRTGGQILVDQLILHGVRQLFCVPGESYLAVLDALHDADIAVTVCRQEGGAAMMAEAQGKLTGRPGICFVTRGPGATNASAGIHIAHQDSTPLIVFVGQVAREALGREAFQELDYGAVFGTMAKWVVQVDDARRLPELLSRAFHVATSGRPGPVVVALPEDMLTDAVPATDALPHAVAETHPGPDALRELAQRLAAAERPVAILGGSRWSEAAVRDFTAFAEAWSLPVYCSFRRQMLFPASHRCYCGDLGLGANPKLLARIRESDLVLLVGGRLSEVPSQGYTLLDIPVPAHPLVHVHADADELGRLYRPAQAIHATPQAFTAALSAVRPEGAVRWAAHATAARADYLAWSDPAPIRIPGPLQMGEVMRHLREVLPPDTIFCNGAGNFATWVHRFWPFTAFASQLAPTSGSMGYGLPAGVGAKRLWPQREVVVFSGDGDFLMHGQEFATAVQYGLPVIVVLLDNGMYGTIRMHQEREYPGRVSATQLRNPDFRAYAQAFGGHGERVERTEDFAPALARARASGLPSVLHCLLDAEAITPTGTLAGIRGAAQAAGR